VRVCVRACACVCVCVCLCLCLCRLLCYLCYGLSASNKLMMMKRGFFGKFDPFVETFLECETMCREPQPGHVFAGSLAEIDPRKVAEVARGSRHIRSLQYSAIRSDIGSPIINFTMRWQIYLWNQLPDF